MMKKEALALLGAALLIAGCGTTPKPPTQLLDRKALQDRNQLGAKLARRGELRAALIQRQILQSFGEEDAKSAAARRDLEAKIRRKVEAAFDSGAEALSKGHAGKARQQFLTVLSLDPGHEAAREELRALEAERVRSQRARVIGSLRNTKKAARKRKAAQAAETAPAEAPPPPSGSKPPKASRAPQAPSQVSASGSQKDLQANLVDPEIAMERTAFEAQETFDEQARQSSIKNLEALIERTAYRTSIEGLETHLARHPEDERAYELLALSHRKIGLDLYGSGQMREAFLHLQESSRFSKLSGRNANERVETALAETKKILADEGFVRGMRAFREDLDQAIALWEEALAYDPQHSQLRLFLYRAYKIKENLRAVKP